jgi:hypothetical protein
MDHHRHRLVSFGGETNLGCARLRVFDFMLARTRLLGVGLVDGVGRHGAGWLAQVRDTALFGPAALLMREARGSPQNFRIKLRGRP